MAPGEPDEAGVVVEAAVEDLGEGELGAGGGLGADVVVAFGLVEFGDDVGFVGEEGAGLGGDGVAGGESKEGVDVGVVFDEVAGGVDGEVAFAAPEVAVGDGGFAAGGADELEHGGVVVLVEAAVELGAEGLVGGLFELGEGDGVAGLVGGLPEGLPFGVELLLEVGGEGVAADEAVFGGGFVDDFEGEDLGVLGVGEAGVGVAVGEELAGEFLLEGVGAGVEGGEHFEGVLFGAPVAGVEFADGGTPGLVVGGGAGDDVGVGFFVGAGEVEAELEVDAALSELGVEVVEAVPGFGVGLAGGGAFEGEGAYFGAVDPVGAVAEHVVGADEVDLAFGEGGGELFGFGVGGVEGDEVDAPEAYRLAVGGDEVFALDVEGRNGVGGGECKTRGEEAHRE